MLKQLASTKSTIFRSFLSQQNSLISAAATTQFTKRAFSTTQSLESVLYIGNVSWSATEQDLSELTSKYGEATIRLPRDQMGRVRGFAFAEFAEEEAAQKAIADLDGTSFLGRDLKVSIAQGSSSGGGGGGYINGPRFGGGGGGRDYGGGGFGGGGGPPRFGGGGGFPRRDFGGGGGRDYGGRGDYGASRGGGSSFGGGGSGGGSFGGGGGGDRRRSYDDDE